MKSTKVSILGTGRVGSSLAYTLVARGTCSNLVLVDIAKDLADGEALDIDQGVPFLNEVNIKSGDYADIVDSDIVVVTLGRARKPGQTRIELAQGNVDIIKSVMPEAVKYAPNATYIIVSNPVDILTYTALKVTSLKPSQVIGSGTQLDSARLRTVVANELNVAKNSVHGYVLGEHGDSSFVPWSVFRLGGMKIADMYQEEGQSAKLSLERIEDDVRKAGGQVIKKKGATNYAIAASVNHICHCILNNTNSILPVSALLSGEYGIEDVCLSLPCVVGSDGISKVLTPEMTADETAKLQHSAQVLKDVIAQVAI